MLDTGIIYDNYAESQKISAEEDPTTHCYNTLVDEATKMGLAWLINMSELKNECNTEDREKELFNPDAGNSEVLMKVRIVVATKDILAGDEIVRKHLEGDLFARAEAERLKMVKAQNRAGFKGVIMPTIKEAPMPKTSTPTKSEGRNNESATNGIAGVVNGVRQKSERAAILKKVKDEERVAAEKTLAAERDKLQDKAKEENRKKRAKGNEVVEENAKKAKTDKESQRAVGKRADDMNISATTKQEPAVRPVGIKTTDDLQSRIKQLEILKINQENTIQQLQNELGKQNTEIGRLEALQETNKIAFDNKLLIEKGLFTSMFTLEQLNNVKTLQTLELRLQTEISTLQRELHGYRVCTQLMAPNLKEHSEDAQYEKNMRRLQEQRRVGLNADEVDSLRTVQPYESVLNMLSPLPESHATRPLEQNALPAIQQNEVLAIEANATL